MAVALGEPWMEAGSKKANPYTRLVRWVGQYRWFALATKRFICKLDRALLRVSGGRLWLSGPEMPTMLLTTRGRRTGKERTVPLYFVRDGEKLVAVSENFGLDEASSWPKNALADPRVKVQIGKSMQDYRARLATDEEIAHSLPLLVEMFPPHDIYMERSGHRYVFVFEPSG